MTIRFNCQHCQKSLKASDQHAGVKVRCSGCRQVVVVPRPETAQSKVARQTETPEEEPGSLMQKRSWAEDELDMTPMIDMTFLLLIFFIATATFSLQKSIEMPAPDQTEAAAQQRTMEEIEEDDDFVIVRIEKDNTIWVNESEARSRHDVLAKLREAREGDGGKGPGSLMVLASGDCLNSTVVMVLDAGTAAKFEGVRLADADEADY